VALLTDSPSSGGVWRQQICACELENGDPRQVTLVVRPWGPMFVQSSQNIGIHAYFVRARPKSAINTNFGSYKGARSRGRCLGATWTTRAQLIYFTNNPTVEV
jgi:hypothetical protein